MTASIRKSNDEWRAQLTPEQYQVAREKGTEPAFSGDTWDTKDDGVYRCVCCDLELFRSDTKFDSGTGWPSFWAAAPGADVRTEVDRGHGMVRTEALCGRCDSHLGHVFPDGPAPTGDRYCINSLALRFEKQQP